MWPPALRPAPPAGVLHFHGQGVPVNHSEAARYFAMAADRDHDAAFNLAIMYQASAVRGTHGMALGHAEQAQSGAEPGPPTAFHALLAVGHTSLPGSADKPASDAVFPVPGRLRRAAQHQQGD